MSTLTYILIFSFIGSVASLIGGALLLLNKNQTKRFYHLLASFAAGALLATAFLDLLPEALEEAPEANIFAWALAGLLGFFILERFLHWFHHHHDEELPAGELTKKPVVSLVLFGDSVHNFIDGLVVGSAFLVDIRLGIVTALATAAHEIPQEIGDFGILLNAGVKKSRVFLYNVLSSLATMVAAVGVYFLGSALEGVLPIFLSVTAGFFIYIAASDIIPEIHGRDKKGFAALETGMLMLGIGLVYLGIRFLD